MLAVEPTAEDLQYWLSSGETTDSLSLRSGVNTRASYPSTELPITLIMTTDPKMVTPTMMTMFRPMPDMMTITMTIMIMLVQVMGMELLNLFYTI